MDAEATLGTKMCAEANACRCMRSATRADERRLRITSDGGWGGSSRAEGEGSIAWRMRKQGMIGCDSERAERSRASDLRPETDLTKIRCVVSGEWGMGDGELAVSLHGSSERGPADRAWDGKTRS